MVGDGIIVVFFKFGVFVGDWVYGIYVYVWIVKWIFCYVRRRFDIRFRCDVIFLVDFWVMDYFCGFNVCLFFLFLF